MQLVQIQIKNDPDSFLICYNRFANMYTVAV